MSNDSLGHYILLDPKDVPSVNALKVAGERLRKDADLLRRMPREKDPPNDWLMKVADFLECFANANDKKLKKEESKDDQVQIG